MRWTEATLKEHLDAAIRTASALLAENYRAQDRGQLIRCMELLDEAARIVEGGIWLAEHPHDPSTQTNHAPAPDPLRAALISRDTTDPARKAG